MATYKVIQDIEAEDKLVGPLTLRQFIYAGIATVCLYICFLAFTKNAQFLIGIFLPVAAVATFFAFPWKGEQPTEIWALARLRFAIKPRVRVWDQDGARDMVTITVPKKVEIRRPQVLTQNEVRSRLKALADTIDSRGWATRNAAYGPYAQGWAHPTVVPSVPNSSGLAVSMPSDDMFDEQNSVAQNFDAMLAKSSEQKRERVMLQMSQAQDPQYQQALQIQAAQAAQQYQQQAAPQPYPQQQAVYQPQPQPQYQYQPAQPGQNFQPNQSPQLPVPVMPATYQQAMPLMPAYTPPVPVAADPNTAPADNWFANGPAYPANAALPPQPVAPAAQQQPANTMIESDMPLPAAPLPTAEEAAIGQNLKQQTEAAMAINYGHLRVLQPIPADGYGATPLPSATGATDYPAPNDDQLDGLPLIRQSIGLDGQGGPVLPAAPPQRVTPKPDPAILEFANNDDLDIATIARQAKKEIQKSPDEVEIRLH